jgi:hypothetical protein
MATYQIEDIVDVVISLGDRPITRAGFTTPLIIVDSDVLSDRVTVFTSAAQILEAGFDTDDDVYVMASKIFSGSARPREIKVGQYDSDPLGGNETLSQGLAAIVDEDSNWFFILAPDHQEATILALAAFAEANKKIYVTSTGASDVITSADDDILSQLNGLQYNNTLVIVDGAADTNFPEAGVIGSVANLIPGSTALHGKTFPGVAVSNFTRTQANFATGKKGNIYSMIGGVGFLKDGWMVSGRFFDVTWGSLYLEARMEEDVFGLISRTSNGGRKISYTDEGLLLIETVMYTRLQQSVAEGFLAANPAPKVFIPLVDDIPQNDRAERIVPNIPFEARLAGAAQTVIIRGYVEA